MNTTKIIVNPYANRWKAKAAIPDIERACRKIGLDYELVVTEGPDHGIELALSLIHISEPTRPY